MSQNPNQQSNFNNNNNNNNNTYPYMYPFNANVYPYYNFTPQTPMNYPQSNFNYMSKTPTFHQSQQPNYSNPTTPMTPIPMSMPQTPSNYSNLATNTYTTPSKLPTQEEILAKVNLLSQRKMMEQQQKQNQTQNQVYSSVKKQKIEETHQGRPLPESFKRFQEKTYKANPDNHREVKLYFDKVLSMLADKDEFYTYNWDEAPVRIFNKSTQNTPSSHPKFNPMQPKNSPTVDMSKYNYTKKQNYQQQPNFHHPYTPLSAASKPMMNNDKQKQQFNYQYYSTPNAKSMSTTTTPKSTVKEKPKKIVGTLLSLEKEYFRNADEPDPSNVRPLYILKQSFEFIKNKVLEGAEWVYISNQMKSIRQDLVIQGIKSQFTVDVYETHARLCLENGDIDEYNRCQGKLKELYNDEIPGNIFEFLAYRILYTVYTGNVIEMNSVLIELNEKAQEREEIKHALKVRESVALNNWHQFFLLYKECPNMGRYIMKRMFRKIRISALKMIYISFRPTIPVSWISNELGFDSLDECIKFLTEIRANFHNKDNLNTKLSLKGLREYENQE